MVASRSSSRGAVLAAFLLIGSLLSGADSASFPVITVCDLLAAPEKYNGGQFSMRIEVSEAKQVIFVDPDNPRCGRIIWALPADQDVRPKPRFKLVEDANLSKFKDGLSVLVPPPSRTKGRVLATVEGRFDSIFRSQNGGKVRRPNGFGHLGLYESRFILHRVVDVAVEPGRQQETPK